MFCYSVLVIVSIMKGEVVGIKEGERSVGKRERENEERIRKLVDGDGVGEEIKRSFFFIKICFNI